MKKTLIITGILILITSVTALGLRFINVGTIGSTSCGEPFESAFKKAVLENNPDYCLSADLNKIHQYKNNKGYYSCSIPKVGLMKSKMALPKGSKEYCLKAMAVATQNVKSCDLIGVGNITTDTCYLVLSKDMGNQNICNLIKDNGVKSVCLKYKRYNGVVKSIESITTPTSIILTINQVDYTVNLPDEPAIIVRNWNYSSLANINIGDTVEIYGIISGDKIINAKSMTM